MHPDAERRRGERRRAAVVVYMRTADRVYKTCRTRDISPFGVFLRTHAPDTRVGRTVELVFVLRPERGQGRLIKTHRRRARVTRVTGRGIGLSLRDR